jgi:hypothetical protein
VCTHLHCNRPEAPPPIDVARGMPRGPEHCADTIHFTDTCANAMGGKLVQGPELGIENHSYNDIPYLIGRPEIRVGHKAKVRQ